MLEKEQNLIKLFKQLNNINQASVLSFAEFLSANSGNQLSDNSCDKREPEELKKPLYILRPEDEKVLFAIKRLSATYSMIKTSAVFDQAAKLMSDHMLHGKDAKLIIDELELLFSEHYEVYCQTFSNE